MVSLEYVQERMRKLKEWSLEGDSIVKDIAFENFEASVEFTKKVAALADAKNHHPLMLLDRNNVRLSLTTHSENGLTEKDFDMAEEIDKMLTFPSRNI
ncbi:MAG: 4a-hydroxytetrahydrobiopterin dehydratase [Nanoarchaeota archaeon]